MSDEDFIHFIQFWFKFFPYNYQTKFLKTCLNSNRVAAKFPRQSGKSQTASAYVLARAILSNVQILIIAPTQSQSKELYEKIRSTLNENEVLKTYLIKSTETEMKFTTGSRIISLPCGPYGDTIRGYTADIVLLEEAQNIKDTILNRVIIPMIASKKEFGQVIKIGTPLTKNHFYHSCYEDDDYELIQITWRDAVLVGQYSADFVKEQKQKLLDIEFRTEYEAEFIDEIASFFTLDLINSCKEEYCLIPYIKC